MELWIEGSIEQVKAAVASGLATTVATNPSIIARWTANGQTMDEVVKEVCRKVSVPVYVQLHGPTVDDFLYEMDALRSISDQIHPKLVATRDGIAATKRLAQDGLRPLVTTISTVSQAFMSAAAGAAYIAPYVGRIEDAGEDASGLVANIARLYALHGVETQIAAASIRSPEQAEKSLLAGAHIVVMQYEIFEKLFESRLTQDWIDRFEENWSQFVFEGRAIHP
ncbi:MAG: hypothetical protein KJ064_23610 [Anaerolineae bacterium]|nr:hypothetical protein [Anaerolineae bacterium]